MANILANEGGVSDLIVLQAALLHDTVEDTNTTQAELTEEFGAEVTGIVMEVTDDKRLPYQERKRLQIVHAQSASPRAKLVKMADKIYNLRDLERQLPQGWTEQRRHEYYKWAEQVVTPCYAENDRLAAILQGIFERHKGRRH